MKIIKYVFFILSIFFLGEVYAQNSIVQVPINQTRTVGWNTSQWDAYVYTRVENSVIQRLPFRIIKPKNFDPLQKYPVLIFLHGRGEAGTDNNFQLKNIAQGVQNAINYVGATFPGYAVFPQEPYGQWTNGPQFSSTQVTTALDMVFDLVDSLVLKFNIDPNRVAISGLSSGGSGAWASLYNRPDLFASAIPISAPGDTSQARKICPIPIWLNQGGTDNNPIPYISHLMMAALRRAGAVDTNITRYIEYPGVGHGCWNLTYANPDLYPYILRHSRLNIMMLGSPSLCPGGKVDLAVRPSPEPLIKNDVFEYQWYFNGSSITGATSNRLTNVSVAGSYFVMSRRTPALPWVASNTVEIVTSPSSPAPVVKANNSIYLPAPSGSSVTLSGPDGQKSYLWSNGATTQSITTNVTGLFSLQTVPQYGCPSDFSTPITVRVGPNGPTPPEAPTDLSAYPTSNRSIIVQWTDNSSIETGYELYRSLRRGGPYTFVTFVGINSKSAFDFGLDPSTTYYYKVRSVNSDGGTLSLEETRATTARDFIKPTEPRNFRFSAFNKNTIQFSWTASFDSAGISKYYIYNRDTLLGTSDTTFFNYPLNSLKRNAFCNFRVIAQDNGGNFSSPSTEIAFVNNGRGLFASYYEGSFSVLPNFSNLFPKVTALVTHPYLNSSAPLLINTLTGGDVTLTNNNIALNFEGFIFINSARTYTFFTTSDDGSKLFINGTQVVNNDFNQGMTERSGTFTFPARGWYPFSVTYRQGTGGYGLNVRYQCSSCTPAIAKSLIPTTVLSYFNTGTLSGVLNPPTANVSLVGSNFYPYSPNDKPRIRLQWTGLPTSFTGVVRGFEVYRISGNTTPTFTSNWQKITTVLTTSGAPNFYSYVDTTNSPGVLLSRNTRYWYLLRAITNIGNSGFIGFTGTVAAPTFLSVLTPNTVPGVPAAPSNLTATGISNSIVTLRWRDNSNNESGFEIWRSYTKDGIYIRTSIVPRGLTVYNDSSCEANSKYVYRIRAFNVTVSAFSNLDSTYTLNMPNPPSDLHAIAVGPNAINLQWNNNSDLAFGYSIYRSTSLNTGYTKIDSIPNPVLTFYQDKSVSPNTEYYYKIRAYNNYNSGFSNVDSAFTLVSTAPETDWKLPAVSVTGSMNTSYMNNGVNRSKLISALLNKNDFFNFISTQPGGTTTILIKLPPLVSMPGGALMSFNLMRGNSGSANPTPADTLEDTSNNFNYDLFNDPTGRNNGPNEISFTVSVSGNTTDSTGWINMNYSSLIYSNYLNKLDIPSTLAGRWLKIQLRNLNTWNRNVYITEMGLYKILPPGKRHNYFLILGASIEQNSKALIGLSRFRKRLANAGIEGGNTALLFNVFSDLPAAAGPGKNSIQLSDGINTLLDRHPNAEYIMVHQGGNNINNEANGMRPLTFDMFQNKPEVGQFINSFVSIYQSILNRGKIPLVSRMTFRDYGKYDNLLTVTSLAVHRGQKQEFGSLPYNLILDSLCRIYAPYVYNEAERRSSLNYYSIFFNDQSIMGGDGLHPNPGTVTANKLIDYWVNFPMGLIYNNTFPTPVPQQPGPLNFCSDQSNSAQSPACLVKYFNNSNYYCCGNIFPVATFSGLFFSPTLSGSNTRAYFPSNKLGLMDSVNAAVALAKRTALGKDLWNARLLVEQVADRNIRVPLVLALDSIRDYRSPASPSNLSIFIVSNSSLSLSWFRNSLNNAGFEVWRSNTSTGNNFRRIAVITTSGATGFLDTGLSGDTIYYYYVKAINGVYSSGWSNIASARPSATYYCKSSGDLALTSTWGIGLDGSGNSPVNFTGTGLTFIIANRGGVSTLNSTMSVIGKYSRVIVSSGNSLSISPNGTLLGVVDLMPNSSISIFSNTNPSFGSIDSTSTINFGNAITIPNKVYGNLNFKGSGIRSFPAGSIDVMGNIGVDAGIVLQGQNNTSTINLYNSSIVFADPSVSTSNLSINVLRSGATLDAKAGVFSLNNLSIVGKASLGLVNSSNLLIGSNGGQRLSLNAGSSLDIKNGNLSIVGNAVLNPNSTALGVIKTNGGSIYFSNSNATQVVHSLLFDSDDNNLNDLKVNLGTVSDTVKLLSPLNMINTVKLSKGVLNTNSYLTLVSDLTSTARIAKVEANARLTGQITAQRVVGPFKSQSVYMLGTPIKSQPVSTWMSFIALQGLSIDGVGTIAGKTTSISTWNESRNVWSGISDPRISLRNGVGYNVRLSTSDINIENSNSGFYSNTGVPVIGDTSGNPVNSFVFPLTKTRNSGGWNVVANPYPSELDWDASGWDKTNISNAYYVYDGASRSYKTYIGATNTSGAVSSSNMTSIINSGQGFLVYVPGSVGNTSFSVTEDAKTESSSLPIFFRKSDDQDLMRLFIENQEGHNDEAIIRFTDESTEHFDLKLDALKLDGNSVNISTITPENELLAINSLPLNHINNIPLRVSSETKGQNKLWVRGTSELTQYKNIYLIDKYKGNKIDLKGTLTYNFEVTSDSLSEGNNRFELQFVPDSNKIKSSINGQLVLYQNFPNPVKDRTTFKFILPYADNVEFKVYNSFGQLIEFKSEYFDAGTNQIEMDLASNDDKALSAGVYYYSITACKSKVIKKMMLLK